MGVLRFDWHAARPAASDVAGVEPVWLHPYSLVPSKQDWEHKQIANDHRPFSGGQQ